jgi:hypothetical protein
MGKRGAAARGPARPSYRPGTVSGPFPFNSATCITPGPIPLACTPAYRLQTTLGIYRGCVLLNGGQTASLFFATTL